MKKIVFFALFTVAMLSFSVQAENIQQEFLEIHNTTDQVVEISSFFDKSSFTIVQGDKKLDVGESAILLQDVDSFLTNNPNVTTTLITFVTSSIVTSTPEVVEEVVTEYVEDKTTTPTSNVEPTITSGDATKLKISEFVPNPEGTDDLEFIELYNPTDTTISLVGLKLDDMEGGSKPYIFPDGFIIEAHSYRAFSRERTKIVLNNTNDMVRLLDGDTIIDEIEYEEVKEGMSLIKHNGNWVWTKHITPEDENILVEDVVEEEQEEVVEEKAKKDKDTVHSVPINQLINLSLDTKVETTGTVSVLPGTFGSQYFYIHDGPDTGVQVYMYKKDFPDLRLGDVIRVSGVLSESKGERRIKLSSREDITVLEKGPELETEEVTAFEIQEGVEGDLVEIEGEITSLKEHYMYVDDGTDEVQVYFKKGTAIDKKDMKVGESVSVAGIVSPTKNGMQLLPRSKEDIVTQKSIEEADTKTFVPEKKQKNYGNYILGVAIVAAGAALYPKYKHLILKS